MKSSLLPVGEIKIGEIFDAIQGKVFFMNENFHIYSMLVVVHRSPRRRSIQSTSTRGARNVYIHCKICVPKDAYTSTTCTEPFAELAGDKWIGELTSCRRLLVHERHYSMHVYCMTLRAHEVYSCACTCHSTSQGIWRCGFYSRTASDRANMV